MLINRGVEKGQLIVILNQQLWKLIHLMGRTWWCVYSQLTCFWKNKRQTILVLILGIRLHQVTSVNASSLTSRSSCCRTGGSNLFFYTICLLEIHPLSFLSFNREKRQAWCNIHTTASVSWPHSKWPSSAFYPLYIMRFDYRLPT